MISGLFNQLESGAGPGIAFRVYDVVAGCYPEDINECDAYITTGSKASVYDQAPWIDRLQEYIVKLHHHDKKLVAICFGHQLVAQAFGGKTEKSVKGWGVGTHASQIYITKDWMQPTLSVVSLLVSHQDQVTCLPKGAELIAGSEFCPYSMFQLGGNILALQGHPEFSRSYAEAMIQYRAQIIGKAKVNEGIVSLQQPSDELTVANWIARFIQFK